jgi:hypothetical protein
MILATIPKEVCMRLVRPSASYTGLLGLLAIALIVPNLLAVEDNASFFVQFALVVAMVGSLWRLKPRRWVLVIASFSALMLEVGAAALQFDAKPAWVVVKHLSGCVFLAMLLATILVNVWRQQVVRVDTIVGGVVAYLMIGVLFGNLYQLLEFVSPGSFVAVHDVGRWGAWEASPGEFPRLFFFSFVTLTTLGYGDVSPGSVGAAALATLQAVMGSLYLTILIARLVGLHIAETRDSRPES